VLADFVQWCIEDGVKIATVYAFSTENWNREEAEVSALMTIFAKYADTLRKESLGKNVRVKVLSTGKHFIVNLLFVLSYRKWSMHYLNGFKITFH
jgi:undecaprenyl diphosphate synthase